MNKRQQNIYFQNFLDSKEGEKAVIVQLILHNVTLSHLRELSVQNYNMYCAYRNAFNYDSLRTLHPQIIEGHVVGNLTKQYNSMLILDDWIFDNKKIKILMSRYIQENLNFSQEKLNYYVNVPKIIQDFTSNKAKKYLVEKNLHLIL